MGSAARTCKWTMALIVVLVLGGCDASSSRSAQQSLAEGIKAYKEGKFEDARRAWLPAAEGGDAEAAYYLGVLANEGHGGNAEESLRWFNQAAAKGHAKAQYNAALAYERGLGTTRNHGKAIEWLSKAAVHDNDAQYMLGLLLINDAGDPADPAKVAAALEWMKKAAGSGNARASYQLATIYSEGVLVNGDARAAEHWYEKALAGGMVETLKPLIEIKRTLAELDKRDLATLQDDAKKGDARAQHALAIRFFKGLGVQKDSGQGMQWLEKAAAAGDLPAQYDYGIVQMGGEGADGDSGMKWVRKAAARNYPRAQYAIAQSYAKGAGVEKDEGTAVHWYRLAAEQSLPEAEYAMGFSYSEGTGVQRDDVQAMQWFKRAANHGHAEAAFRISTMYGNGEGVAKNPQEIRRWECRAMVLGSERASDSLAKQGGFESACAEYTEDLASFAVNVLGSTADQGKKSS
jgi:uncharacterized protein